MAAVALSDNDKNIGFPDAHGVLLSAVQALDAKLQAKDAEVAGFAEARQKEWPAADEDRAC